jgi:histone acetyltransferase (RNA polymerase elongator complex component)
MLINFSARNGIKTPVQLFYHPEPVRPKRRIWPVFMPFSGCPYRCVYCAQEKQTGHDVTSLDYIYQQLVSELKEYFENSNHSPLEIAFFGGTFTALPKEWQLRFLALADDYKKRGLLTRVRCSTRPDCVSPELLAELKDAGLDMVELGIQSFANYVLEASLRQYDSKTAVEACELVKKSGLSLGIQLLPGLPGSVFGDLYRDISITRELNPEAVRIYPCLVVRGTVLHKWYERGEYIPWSVERAVEEVSSALLRLWNRNIAVIRSGVALEQSFRTNIIAGPVHDAFGQMARSKALYLYMRARLASGGGYKPLRLEVPARYSGEFWGHRRNLSALYSRFGLTRENVSFHSGNLFHLFF